MGFTFKTNAFRQVKTTKDGSKPRMGLGKWTRANSEPCLLCTQGHPKRTRRDVAKITLEEQDNTILAPLTAYSAKPDQQYERIERLVDGPFFGLFARQTRHGGTPLGNGIDGQDIQYALRGLLPTWTTSNPNYPLPIAPAATSL